MNPKESAPKSKPTQEPDPARFANFEVLEDESGFKIQGTNHIFLFDSEGGWFDEYGNYYNADAVPCTPPELSLEEEEITKNLENKEQQKEEEKEADDEDEAEEWNDDEDDEEDDTINNAYALYKKMAGKFTEEEESKVEAQSTTTKASNQTNRFEEFWPVDDQSGFNIDGTDHIFVFDSQGGWYDEKGNYFNADGVSQPAPEYKDKQLEKFLKEKASLEKFYVRNLKLKTAKKDLQTYLEKQKTGVELYDIHFFNDEKNSFSGSALIAVKDGSKLLSLNGKEFSRAPLVIVKYAA